MCMYVCMYVCTRVFRVTSSIYILTFCTLNACTDKKKFSYTLLHTRHAHINTHTGTLTHHVHMYPEFAIAIEKRRTAQDLRAQAATAVQLTRELMLLIEERFEQVDGEDPDCCPGTRVVLSRDAAAALDASHSSLASRIGVLERELPANKRWIVHFPGAIDSLSRQKYACSDLIHAVSRFQRASDASQHEHHAARQREVHARTRTGRLDPLLEVYISDTQPVACIMRISAYE